MSTCLDVSRGILARNPAGDFTREPSSFVQFSMALAASMKPPTGYTL